MCVLGVAPRGRAASSLPNASLRADVANVGAQMHQLMFVDNVPWHYWHGTSASFSVR